MNVKPAVTQKRIKEIEKLQERIRQLGAEFKKDFSEPPALASVIEQDLKTAADSLDLLKGFYTAKTDK